MSLTKSLLFTLLLSAAAVQASTDEIERLESAGYGYAACTTGSRHVSQDSKAGSPLVPPQ